MNIAIKELLKNGLEALLITFVILGIMFLIKWLYWNKFDNAIDSNTMIAIATVVDIKHEIRRRNVHICKFTVENKDYYVKVAGRGFEEPMPIGTKLKVKYAKDDPTKSRIIRPLEIVE